MGRSQEPEDRLGSHLYARSTNDGQVTGARSSRSGKGPSTKLVAPLATSPEDLVRETAQLKPTHLIVGSGWWKVQAPSSTFWTSLAAAGLAAVAAQGGKVYYRASVRPNNVQASCRGLKSCLTRDYDSSPLLDRGWQLYDVHTYVRARYNGSGPGFDEAVFADGIHLNPGANAELVSGLLMPTICSGP